MDAPFIEEFPFALECKLLHTIEIGLHVQFIGEIVDIKADEDVFDENGIPDIDRVKPILFAPVMQAYYGVGDFLGKAFSIGKKI